MTQTAVIIVGAGAAGLRVADSLLRADISEFVILEQVVSSVFDDDTDTWTLHTREGERCQAGVVIAAYPPMHVPWIPDLLGRNDFRGESFHSATWDSGFEATGKRIAVVGADATTGHFIDRLATSAASVKVFAHPPRRIIPEVLSRRTRAKRSLHRQVTGAPAQPAPQLVRSPIDTLTATGIRTRDGVHFDVDAIIYGTGFAIPETVPDQALVGAGGLTIRQAWHEGMEPYLGVAVHGFPNYFMLTGPDVEAQTHYIAECLRSMERRSRTRIEVRRSSQQVFNERMYLRPPMRHPAPRAFDLSSSAVVDAEVYDGPATLTMADARRQVRVRLTGHLDPIDGRFHWQGTIFDRLSAEDLKQTREVTVAVGDRNATARITEQTPWGTHSIAGAGAPPFALADVELALLRP